MNLSYTIWIPLLPLLSFVINGLFYGRMPKKMSGWLGTSALGISTLLSWVTAWKYFFNTPHQGPYEDITAWHTTWMHLTDRFTIDLGIYLDPISIMMLIVVTTVSFLVHLYSIGYMATEEGRNRYFAWLGLFSFSMLGLVLAPNLIQTYMFWELVGVSSFLLIGYYYDKPSAVKAALKAFIVTRFADGFFLIGILLYSYYSGSFLFEDINNIPAILESNGSLPVFMGLSALTWGLLLIFIGGAGKSAMFPLHIWLPDAMEGPTPVSALIHAATMVVAGVYLVARLFPAFHASDHGFALQIVAIVGTFSSLFAAIIAMTQMDIKRVLAFSTMSQIGYMMTGLGVSGIGEEGLGYTASMFHLFTHAAFKALLFLGAGALIHAVHSNSLKDMGSLRKYMPISHITFLIACLAISGIPPFAGFFSKDLILEAAFEKNKLIYAVGWITAGLTAFYMFRIYFMAFWGEDKVYAHKPHDPGITMTLPLIVLAIASALAGWLPFNEWVTSNHETLHTHFNIGSAAASVAIGLVGIIIAYILYKNPSMTPQKMSNRLGVVYQTVKNKFYVDEFYEGVTQQVILKRIATPIAWFDRHIVDGTMNLIGNTTVRISSIIKGIQSGDFQVYAFGILIAVIGLLVWLNYFIQ